MHLKKCLSCRANSVESFLLLLEISYYPLMGFQVTLCWAALKVQPTFEGCHINTIRDRGKVDADLNSSSQK